MNKSIFRAYDIRGVYPRDINEGVVYQITRHFRKIFGSKKTIVIGHDVRESSPALYEALAAGLRVGGLSVVRVGSITTPALSFFVKQYCAHGGVVITASHNPPEYNGLKVIGKDTIAIGGHQILKKIGWKAITDPVDAMKIAHLPDRVDTQEDATMRYASFLSTRVSLSRPISVVCDASNGSTGAVIEALQERALVEGMSYTLLHTDADPLFRAHGPDPSDPHTWIETQKEVVRKGADFGVIFDGDGDRAVFVDEKGNHIPSACAWRLFITDPRIKKSVHTVLDSFDVGVYEKELKEAGAPVPVSYETKVGHLFVGEKMKEEDADIGFEYSGHFYFKECGGTGSGLLAMLFFAQMLSRMPYSASEFFSLLPSVTHFPEETREIEGMALAQSIARIKKQFSKKCRVTYKDGVSVHCGDAWASVRPSNTQPLIRIEGAATNRAHGERLMREIKKFVK